MTEKNSGLSVVINNNGHISFNADLNFSVEQKDDQPVSVHLADAVYSVVLEALKNQVDAARLLPGDFRLLLTGCVSDVSNTTGVEDATENAEESAEEESSDEESVETTEEAEAEATEDVAEESTQEVA